MKHELLSVALITVLLLMVLGTSIGCGTTTPTTYTLTIASTAGGNVTPAVGTHTYAANTVINLNATPDSGYRFVNWTDSLGHTVTAAQTTFKMPPQDAWATAHFALGTLIANVPDTNWTGANPANYCAPLAMVNILGYWDEVMGRPSAYNVTAWQQPSNLTTVANYVGYFMDTNNAEAAKPANLRGNDADGHFGTYAKDITPGGTMDYVRWDGGNLFNTPPPALPAGKLGYTWTGTDDYSTVAPVGFPFIKTEIDAGRPLVVCYRWWNLIPGINVTDPQSGKVISVYMFGSQTYNSTNPPEEWNGSYGEGCIGHAVTCVGYILNWNPLGGGAANWTIVHDTWSTTPENIAVPWIFPGGPWNSSHAVLP
jgi:hypothetical protein